MILSYCAGILLCLSVATCLNLNNYTYLDIINTASYRWKSVGEFEPFHKHFTHSDLDSTGLKPLSPWKVISEAIKKAAENGVKTDNTISNCINSMEYTISALRQGDLWAIKMIDAAGKPGSGILEGNFAWLGSFTECNNITATRANDTNNLFKGQYCGVSFMKSGTPYPPPFGSYVSIGLCIPSTCSQSDIQDLISIGLIVLDVKIEGVVGQYHRDSIPLTSGAISVIVLLSVIGCAVLVGTFYDVFIHQPAQKKTMSNVVVVDPVQDTNTPTFVNEDNPIDIQDYTPILKERQEQNELSTASAQTNTTQKVFLAFSLYSNGKKILNTKRTPGTLDCIHGIRFLSMSWVILGHTTSFIIYSTSNLVVTVEWFKRWTFQAVANATFSVDSFFVLSGTLVSYLLLKRLRSNHGPRHVNWALFYFHRVWRLTPIYMLVLGFYATTIIYIGDGPLWQIENKLEPYCNESWWTNLLYINNLVYEKKQCMGWSWYLANDMQFFIISPFVIVAFYYKWFAGAGISVVLILINFLNTGLIATETYGKTAADAFADIYIKPWCRIGPYVVGIVTGYLLHITDNQRLKIHKTIVLLGWALAAACNLAVLYGLSDHDTMGVVTLSKNVSAFYTACSRTAWGLGLAWVIFACCRGYGAYVNTLLSWPGMVPLSRLTYAAYLIHPMVLYYYNFTLQQTIIMNEIVLIWMFLGGLAVSYGLAFVVSLALEAPMMALEKVIFPKF